jgi:methionine synthase II (cobalamin-independent)
MQLADGTAYTLTAYTSSIDYFADLSLAYRAEIEALYLAGLRSIQIDDPNLTFFLDSSFLSGCETDRVDPNELLEMYIQAHNACLSYHPKDLHIGIHLCRGNMSSSTHVTTGSYEAIAKRIFTQLKYDTFYLEYDDPHRSGGFEPLRYLPVGKNVVLGVVSTKMPELEDLDILVRRVESAADVIAEAQGRTREVVLKEVLGVSPQCGFASMSIGGGKGMDMERMWEKLVLVRELAKKIWGNKV